jgi:AbrB family looped-hinge helix DNA binding protein
MKTRVSSNGHIVLPAELRKKDRIKSGQEFEIERVGAGDYRLKRRKQRKTRGLVDWLLACPVKGYFRPMDRKQTTSDLKPPTFG